LDKTKAKAKSEATPEVKPEQITVTPPNFMSAQVKLVGTAPLVMNRMSSQNREKMMRKQEAGSRSTKGQIRKPKDFDAVFRGAMHISEEGWYGIPASALRAGMISACRLVGFKMTIAKMTLFVKADGYDKEDGQPLIKLTVGKPVRRDMPVKLADGSTDILARPFFNPWAAEPVLEWDADQFSAQEVVNLLSRVGLQVGVGAGRADSKNSTGMGWGSFSVQAI
jgi:hypothetical protein